MIVNLNINLKIMVLQFICILDLYFISVTTFKTFDVGSVKTIYIDEVCIKKKRFNNL